MDEITISCLCGTYGCSGESCNPTTYKLATYAKENRRLRGALTTLHRQCTEWDVVEGHRKNCARFKGNDCDCETGAAIEDARKAISGNSSISSAGGNDGDR